MYLFDLLTRFRSGRWSPLPIRLIVGFGFIEHGFAKLSKGPDAFAAILHAMGVPAPHLMAWVTILTEIGGGSAVFLGGLVTLAALPMAAVLLVAVFTVHLPYGFSSIKLINVTAAGAQFGPPGYECDLLYLACLASLVMTGPGPLALDEFIGAGRHKLDTRAGCTVNGERLRSCSAVASPRGGSKHTTAVWSDGQNEKI